MTSHRIMEFRMKHHLTCSDLARILGVHKSQITRWELGKQAIPGWLEKFLDCLEKSDEFRKQ